jgi:hypothetical protein
VRVHAACTLTDANNMHASVHLLAYSRVDALHICKCLIIIHVIALLLKLLECVSTTASFICSSEAVNCGRVLHLKPLCPDSHSTSAITSIKGS